MRNVLIVAAVGSILVLKASIVSADVYTWTLDSSQSYARMSLPNQTTIVSGVTVTVRPRSAFATGITGAGSGNILNDSTGAKATLSGTFQADYEHNSVTILDGSSDISAASTVPLDVAPDPAAWDATTKTYTSDSTAPADMASLIFLNMAQGLFNTKTPFAIRDLNLSLRSGYIYLPDGTTINAGSTKVGIESAAFQMKQATLIADITSDGVNTTIDNLEATNLLGGQILDLGNNVRQMILNYSFPIAFDLEASSAASITGTISGVVVATTTITVPEVGPIVLGSLTMLGLAATQAIRRRRSRSV